ncbi:MAG: hypothetical protein ACOYK8_04665 [Alphaproteobacteria bacterium]
MSSQNNFFLNKLLIASLAAPLVCWAAVADAASSKASHPAHVSVAQSGAKGTVAAKESKRSAVQAESPEKNEVKSSVRESSQLIDDWVRKLVASNYLYHTNILGLGVDRGTELSFVEGEAKYFFPVPSGVQPSEASFDLGASYQSAFAGQSHLQLSVEDMPLATVGLTSTDQVLSSRYPLSVANISPWIKDGFLAVKARYSGAFTKDRCYDQRVLGDRLYITPQTGITLSYPSYRIDGLEAAMRLLPHEVTISLPAGQLDEGGFETALSMASSLTSAGHQVRFERLPHAGMLVNAVGGAAEKALVAVQALYPDVQKNERGVVNLPDDRSALAWALAITAYEVDDRPLSDHDKRPANGSIGQIVLASQADLDALRSVAQNLGVVADQHNAKELSALLKQRFLVPAASTALQQDANVSLLRLGTQPLVWLKPSVQVAGGTVTGQPAAAWLGGVWQPTASGQTAALVSVSRDHNTGKNFVPWEELPQQSTAIQDISYRGSWVASVPLYALPAGTRPERLVLDIMPGVDSVSGPTIAQVEVNGVLLYAERVEQGKVHRISVTIPVALVRLFNTVEVTVQRALDGGDCLRTPASYSAQLLPSSRVELSDMGEASAFHDLSSLFRQGLTIYLPQYAAEQSEIWLEALSALSPGLISPNINSKIQFVASGSTPAKPTSHFLAFGVPLPEGVVEPPILLDKGRVTVRALDNSVLLDLVPAQPLWVAQLTKMSDYQGLWLSSQAMVPPPTWNKIGLDRGDTAFLDRERISLYLHLRSPAEARVEYPATSTVQDVLKRYWTAALVLLWLVLSLVFALYLKRHYRSKN